MPDGNGKISSFPGIDNFRQKLICRSMGSGIRHIGEFLGAGFMHKDHLRIDAVSRRQTGYVLVIVLRGRGTYVADDDGAEYALSAGSFFQRLPGIAHSVYLNPDSQWVECYLEIGEKFAAALESMGILKFDPPVGKARITPELLDRIWHFMLVLENASEAELPGLAGEIISLLDAVHDRSRPTDMPQMNRLIEQACRMLGSSFYKYFDLKEFCTSNGCGYENFRKQFRKEVGLSPGQYRVRRRLDAAASLLREGKLSIARIAAALGYSSPYEFSAQFKRKYGMSPRQYRG